MKHQILDIECYSNYFLLLILDPETGTVHRWEMLDDVDICKLTKRQLHAQLKNRRTVTFNGMGYDMYLVDAYISGETNAQLKKISDHLILEENGSFTVTRTFSVSRFGSPHLDLMPIAPLMASLKIYAGRMGVKLLQELPVDPSAEIDSFTRETLVLYCINDLYATLALLDKLRPQVDLRVVMSKTYDLELYSKSDAQIAEAVIKKLLTADKPNDSKEATAKAKKNSSLKVKGVVASMELNEKIPEIFRFDAPSQIKFRTDVMKGVHDTAELCNYTLGASGALLCPPSLRVPFNFYGRRYKMGIGGLHSTEKKQAIVIGEGEYLTDLDVTSYYPSMILNHRLSPASMGDSFLDVYKGIVDDRIKAKSTGDNITSDALKIVINSSFGKFGSKYSALYSPKLLLQTTISGQLYLLMLIEAIETETLCSVVSANTDGITVHSPSKYQYDLMLTTAAAWEASTRLNLESVEYRAVYSQDVNNYVAIKTDGTHKGKGLFAAPSLSKNPAFPIIPLALIELFKDGTTVEETITQCRDINMFVTLRKVTGGAFYHDEDVGSTVRWYLSLKGSPILYMKNANRVPNAETARLINDLPDRFPSSDIDYDQYINRAYQLLGKITDDKKYART